MNTISRTALITLQCHALDAAYRWSILNDVRSIETLALLRASFPELELSKKPKRSLARYVAIRAREYDRMAIDFIKKHPEAIIVNIGCGLDHRFERIDNGRIAYFDLDLPDIMNIKTKIFPPTSRYHQISMSVLDPTWMDQVSSGPLLLLAEGVFMYLETEDIKDLLTTLCKQFTAFDIFFEVFNKSWLKGWRQKIVKYRLQKEMGCGGNSGFKFGISRSDELESWHDGLIFVKDWSITDELPGMSKIPVLGPFEIFRKMLWSVHYRFVRRTASKDTVSRSK